MDLVDFLKKLTAGKVLFQTFSPINRKIQVLEDLSGRRLVVGGLTQSGGQVGRIWKKAIGQVSRARFPVPKVLILGLGGGTLARLVFQKWPRAKMTGVEIDPQIVEIGKRYFDLDKIPNLKIVIEDAAEIVSQPPRVAYQLIFVDLYLADQVPARCETVEFLKGLARNLAWDGLVIFNRLDYREHQKKTEVFLDKLDKIFQTLRKKKVGGNLLVFAQKKDV